MAELRIRIEWKRRGRGVPIPKLTEGFATLQRLLRMLGEDARVESLQEGWRADDFYSGSLGFTVQHFGGAVDEQQARAYSGALRQVVSYKPSESVGLIGVRSETLLQYARLANVIDPGERVRLGLFENGATEPDWHELAKNDAVAIFDHFEEMVEYHGMIQGIIHSLYKEVEPPYFDVRELSSDELVKCFFAASQYHDVIKLLDFKAAVVLVSGQVQARRIDRRIEGIHIEKMEATERLSLEEFKRLQGSAPDLTGDLTTGQFIERMRRDGGV